jgi:delta 1-pyrroline-5-carboxylate dehydrogenase
MTSSGIWISLLCVCFVGANANGSQPQKTCSTLIGLSAAKGSKTVFNVYINGEFRPSVSGRTQPVIAPFNDSVVYEVPVCTREEIDEAFAAAKAAQKGWSRTPLWKRAELLKKAALKLREHAEEIAEVIIVQNLSLSSTHLER